MATALARFIFIDENQGVVYEVTTSVQFSIPCIRIRRFHGQNRVSVDKNQKA